jgi:hypothetical protein
MCLLRSFVLALSSSLFPLHSFLLLPLHLLRFNDGGGANHTVRRILDPSCQQDQEDAGRLLATLVAGGGGFA